MPTRKHSDLHRKGLRQLDRKGIWDMPTIMKMVNKNTVSINDRLIRALLSKMVNEVHFNQGLEFEQICFFFFIFISLKIRYNSKQ